MCNVLSCILRSRHNYTEHKSKQTQRLEPVEFAIRMEFNLTSVRVLIYQAL